MIGIGDDWVSRYLLMTSVIPHKPAAEMAILTASNFVRSDNAQSSPNCALVLPFLESEHLQQQTVDAKLTGLQLGKPCKTRDKDNALDTKGPITSGLHQGCGEQSKFDVRKPTARYLKVVSSNLTFSTNKSHLSQKENGFFF
jgi:hypothetical protein